MSRQFSSSKIHIQWVLFHLFHHRLLFFFGQFRYHHSDPSVHIFPSLLLLRFIIRTLILSMSNLLALKAGSFLHQFCSFIGCHGIYVHGIWVSFLLYWELEPLFHLTCRLSRFVLSSKDALHLLPVGMELHCFLVPFLQGCWWVFTGHHLLLKWGGECFPKKVHDSHQVQQARSGSPTF